MTRKQQGLQVKGNEQNSHICQYINWQVNNLNYKHTLKKNIMEILHYKMQNGQQINHQI